MIMRDDGLVRRIESPGRLKFASRCIAVTWICWFATMAAILGLAFDAPANIFGTLLLVAGLGMLLAVVVGLLLGSSIKCPWCQKSLMFAGGRGGRGAMSLVQDVLGGRNVRCANCGRTCTLEANPGA